MSDESESNSSDAVARRSSEAETLLGLQKMIASLEGDKDKLGEEPDRRDDEFERGRARASELEAELRAARESNAAAREEVREGFE